MSLLTRFGKDASGNVGMLFGLALLPIVGLAGAAVDYARASAARATLAAAVDSAALVVAREASRSSDAQLRGRAEAYLNANLAGNADLALAGVTIQIDRPGRAVHIAANAAIQTSLTRILGIDSMALSATALSSWGTNTIELALVLDNTGSMATSGKIQELKRATRDLIDEMERTSRDGNAIRIAIVPFATKVRLDQSYADADWLRFQPTLPKAQWRGCVADRDQPNDAADGVDVNRRDTLHPAVACAGDESALARLQPLTDNWSQLRRTTDAMTPSGYTNLTIGLAWGMAALSRGAPLAEAAAPSPGLKKYMIVLTDGLNTRNRFGETEAQIDFKTGTACTAAKAAGVQVYTIRVIEGNAGLLRDCASSPEMYFDVRSAAGIGPVIAAIAREISAVRLTS